MSILRTAGRAFQVRRGLVDVAAVTSLSLASSAIGFVFQVVLAARFGAGTVVDTYLFAISAPTFLAGLMTAALSYTLVPALVRLDTDPDARRAALRRLVLRNAGVALCFALLGLPAAVVQPMVLPGRASLDFGATLPWMIALGWMTGGANLFAASFIIELNAARRPVVAALLTLPTNLVAVVAVLIGPRSIVAAPTGVLAGSLMAAAGGLVLVWHRLRSEGDGVGLTSIPPMRVGGISWTLLAMSCFSGYAVVDAFWAPRAGAGTLATLGYAQRLIIGIGGLVLAGPSAILVPKLSARLRDDGARPFLREAARVTIAVGAIAIVISTVLVMLADPLIRLAFGRGEFGSDDATRVARVLRAMLPGFCAMLVSVSLTRAIYCLPGVERPMAIIGSGWTLAYFLLCGLGHSFGEVGFGVSYSAAWTAYLVCAVVVLRRYALRITTVKAPSSDGA